jgi:DNA-directed RNA polymerase sigma subunit (sigma70/sigma32)
VETPLECYESQLRLINEVCADPWFAEQLALSQAGDQDAGRRISGSCLRLVFDIAKRRWRPDSQLSLLEFVEEGNVALMKTVKRFAGSRASEFLRELTQNVESWYRTLPEHPGWARERRDSWAEPL